MSFTMLFEVDTVFEVFQVVPSGYSRVDYFKVSYVVA